MKLPCRAFALPHEQPHSRPPMDAVGSVHWRLDRATMKMLLIIALTPPRSPKRKSLYGFRVSGFEFKVPQGLAP